MLAKYFLVLVDRGVLYNNSVILKLKAKPHKPRAIIYFHSQTFVVILINEKHVHKVIRHDHCCYGKNNLYQIGFHSCDKCSSRTLLVQAIRQSAVLTNKIYARFLLEIRLDVWIYFGDIQGCCVSQDVSLGCLQMVFGNLQINPWIESIRLDLKPNHSGH